MGMKKVILVLIALFLCYLAALLANPPRDEYFAALSGQSAYTVWVSSNGWHTGIIVPTELIPRDLLPEKRDFPTAAYLEIGWGDAGFYQAETITTSIALKALFLPTPSVVHMVGFSTAPEEYFTASDVLRFEVGEEGFRRLLQALDASVGHGETGAVHRKKGLYGDSRFYAGRGNYSALHTCNHWAADMLTQAGIPITPWYAATSGTLMWQLRRYATHQEAKKLPSLQHPASPEARQAD